jgi:hypothetical protein
MDFCEPLTAACRQLDMMLEKGLRFPTVSSTSMHCDALGHLCKLHRDGDVAHDIVEPEIVVRWSPGNFGCTQVRKSAFATVEAPRADTVS